MAAEPPISKSDKGVAIGGVVTGGRVCARSGMAKSVCSPSPGKLLIVMFMSPAIPDIRMSALDNGSYCGGGCANCKGFQSTRNGGLAPVSDPSLLALMNSSKPELGVVLTKVFPATVLGVGIGEKEVGMAGAEAVVGL